MDYGTFDTSLLDHSYQHNVKYCLHQKCSQTSSPILQNNNPMEHLEGESSDEELAELQQEIDDHHHAQVHEIFASAQEAPAEEKDADMATHLHENCSLG